MCNEPIKNIIQFIVCTMYNVTQNNFTNLFTLLLSDSEREAYYNFKTN